MALAPARRVNTYLRCATRYAMKRYYICNACKHTRVVNLMMTSGMQPTQYCDCLRNKANKGNAWRMVMQEISATDYIAIQNKAVKGKHYTHIVTDDVIDWGFPPRRPQTRNIKCYKCGQMFKSTAALPPSMCTNCEALLWTQWMNVLYDAFTAAPVFALKPKTIYWHCTSCGDVVTDSRRQCAGCCATGLSQYEATEEPMTPNTNVRIWWDASIQAYRLASPFNKDLVDSLKSLIPHSDRSFDPNTKIWTFIEKWLAPTQTLLKTLNCQPTVVTRAQAEQATSSPQVKRGSPLADVALEFMRVAGHDAMQKAYRAASMTLHPDRGGSMDAMSALNAAWDRLQKEVFSS